MQYTREEVLQYVSEEDVKFIRLAFCDVFGVQKNIAIMPSQLERAFTYGIPIDASLIAGFEDAGGDLFLKPDPATLSGLPWRPESGRVVRMYCSVCRPDGSVLEADSRALLAAAVEEAARGGLRFDIGPKMEFYVFERGESGEPSQKLCDNAGYLDIAPADKGENLRREICLTLEQMGMIPESSHHEAGPGQNEIDFRYADPLSAADNAVTFRQVASIIAGRNGLAADFSPKPFDKLPGSGMHVNFSVNDRDDSALLSRVIAGILEKSREMTLFLNPTERSYARLGRANAPGAVSWSQQNRSQLVRIPASPEGICRAELRSPDAAANPYLVFALLIRAGLWGVQNACELPPAATGAAKERFEKLPASLAEARDCADSDFIRSCVPEPFLRAYGVR